MSEQCSWVGSAEPLRDPADNNLIIMLNGEMVWILSRTDIKYTSHPFSLLHAISTHAFSQTAAHPHSCTTQSEGALSLSVWCHRHSLSLVS